MLLKHLGGNKCLREELREERKKSQVSTLVEVRPTRGYQIEDSPGRASSATRDAQEITEMSKLSAGPLIHLKG